MTLVLGDPRNPHQHEQDILWNTWDTTHSIKSHILTPNQLNLFFLTTHCINFLNWIKSLTILKFPPFCPFLSKTVIAI